MNEQPKSNIFLIAFEIAKYSGRRKKNGHLLGAFWCLLEPLILFYILLLLRGHLPKGDIEHYPLYLFIGLFCFHFFSSTTRRIMSSLNSYSRYIKTFPLPLNTYFYATFFETMIDFSYQLGIILILLVWQSLPIIYLVPFVGYFVVFSIFCFGIGVLFSGIAVYFKDIEVIWGLVCRVLFFATPIFYTFSEKASRADVGKLNPLTWYLNSLRGLLIEQQFNFVLIAELVLLSVTVFLVGNFVFSHLQKRIAEVL